MSRRYPIVLAVFFLSGFSSLVYQVVWVKLLTRTFGVTAFAVSAVLGAFFAGLALGSYLGGRLADRPVFHSSGTPLDPKGPRGQAVAIAPDAPEGWSGVREHDVRADRRTNGLRLYGWLEIFLALYALALPGLFEGLTPLYRALYPTVESAPALITAARFGLSFLLLILPTTLMGATLPLLVRALVESQEAFAGRLSRLYAINTLGAVAGTLSTGYVLIGIFGLQVTTVLAALGNLAAGLVALALAPGARAAPAPQPAPLAPAAAPPSPLAALTLLTLFLSGFAALGYEVIWTRVFSVLSDHSVYAFSAIVATVLIGIALGSEWVGRAQGRIGDPVRALGLVEAALGVTAIASLPASALVARVLPTLDTSFGPARLSGNPVYFFLIVFAVVILPSLCMGASFPLAAQIYARSADRMGQRVGEIYSANVLGATLGSITVGFVMLPLVGAQRSLLAAALLNLIAAAGLLGFHGRPRAALGSAALALAALIALAAAPNDLYRWLFAAQYPANRIVANFEDIEMTVTVTEYNAHQFIFLNGHHQAETLPVTLGIHRLIGHLPAVVHGAPRTALVIGLGGGATGGAVSQHVRERLDIVELSAGMVEAAGLFAPYNNDVLSNRRTRLVIADGRNFLLLAETKYDLITADIIPPLHAYSSLLYSHEYFRLLSAHLNPGGVVSQWLDRRLEPHEQDILIRTFARAFPHVTLWQRDQYTLLLGSNQPIQPDPAALARAFSPQLAADLSPLGITSPGDLAGGFGLAGDALRSAVGPGLILTDDHPYNEYFRLLRIGSIWRFLPEN